MKDKLIQWISQQIREQLQQLSGTKKTSATAVATDQVSTLSQAGMDMIAQFEGFERSAYLCPAQVWTIGFGTTVYPNGQRVQRGDQCNRQQALQYKRYDLQRFEKTVQQAVTVPLQQHQFDALVSLTYNIGSQAFKNSTLLKHLNQGHYAQAAAQFLVWNKAGGKVLQGLVNRRQIEKARFENKS